MSYLKTVFLIGALASLMPVAIAEVAAPQQHSSPLTPAPGDSNFTRVSKVCGLLSVMSTDAFKGSEQDVARTYALSTYYICQAHAMPPDWPDAPATLEKGRKLFRQAQAQMPNLANPETSGDTFERLRTPTPGQ